MSTLRACKEPFGKCHRLLLHKLNVLKYLGKRGLFPTHFSSTQ